MKVEELEEYGISKDYIEKLKEEKITELYPPQAEVVKKGLFKERNLVISMPTAGGKTLLATLSIIEKLAKTKKKVVYIVPLVALGDEKFNYFKSFFEKKYKVALSVGDYDSVDSFLTEYDMVIVTSEKLDSLLRHNITWTKDIGLVIVDEIHLLDDSSRGPTLEILITKLRELCPRANILALSATIKNAKELSEWLNATLVLSDFRPVKLYQGISYDSKILFPDSSRTYQLNDGDSEDGIVENTLDMQKQCLFFVATRRSAESLAEKLCGIVKFKAKRGEHFQLEALANNVENVLENPTKQCKRLAKCVKNGAAFHHAGLLRKQKRLIEENFRNGLVKIICATPTLAMGINLPAFRVIIRDAKRFYPTLGAVYIPVLDYYQMIGRCGRPQWDEFGESILIAKSEEDSKDLTERFIHGEPEHITSKLAVEPILRMHTLALIASEFCKSEKSLLEFFSKTFYSFHYGNIYLVEEKLLDILNMLVEWKFIQTKGGKLIATRIGKRTSELYIDPLTAHNFTTALIKAAKLKSAKTLSYTHLISNTREIQPYLSVRVGEVQEIEKFVLENENAFLQNIPEQYDLEFEDFFKSVKTTLLLESWIDENTEDQILTKFRVAPGELRNRLETADWLIYSVQELALLLGYKEILKDIRKLRVRMRYGIKEELLPLVKLRDIGRVRARILYRSGLTSLEKLREIPYNSLSSVIGAKVAKSIKDQLEGKKEAKEEIERQITLKDF